MSVNIESRERTGILDEIQTALLGLRFGSVEIIVHNGQVVQIERREKVRLQPAAAEPSAGQASRQPVKGSTGS